MAKLITKFKYLKPNARQSVGGYAKYTATREGVDKIDQSYKLSPSSLKQQQLIEEIIKDFPDSKEMLEYEDYLKEPTVGNASEFITRALEDNAYEVMQSKTYADYIATRPRAERFGSHGLFTDDGVQVKLGEVSDELNHHDGNVWTVIISLRREDAERLGYNNGERWRDMLRTKTNALAKSFKIPMESLHWYAAFHNESHHPHVHLMVYSDRSQKPYLSRQGIMSLRSSLARDIFGDDLREIYQRQTEHRDDLRLHSSQLIAEIVEKINSGVYDNPTVEEMRKELADRLYPTSGKKQYGYLKSDVKAIVNRIVMELAADERIAALYDLWYEQREKVLGIYTQDLPERIPLVDNEEFKSVKNAVIQEAMNILADITPIDEDTDDLVLDTPEPEPEEIERTEQESESAAPISDRERISAMWRYYRQAKELLNRESEDYDADTAVDLLIDQKPIVQAYVMDDIFEKLEGANAAIGTYYYGDYLTMYENNPDLAFALPREGTNLYVDAMCIPKGAENKENAEAFINFMCSTEAGLKNCEEIWYSTPLLSVREQLDPEVLNDPYAYPDETFIAEQCETFTCLPADIRTLYSDEWVRLMNAS